MKIRFTDLLKVCLIVVIGLLLPFVSGSLRGGTSHFSADATFDYLNGFLIPGGSGVSYPTGPATRKRCPDAPDAALGAAPSAWLAAKNSAYRERPAYVFVDPSLLVDRARSAGYGSDPVRESGLSDGKIGYAVGPASPSLSNAAMSTMMDCAVAITAATSNCTFASGTNSFTLDLTVVATDPPVGEDLVVTVNGNQVATQAPDASGTTQFAGIVLSEAPGSATVAVGFATTAACTAGTNIRLVACTPACTGAADELGGNVFVDNDNNGANAGAGEVGQGNVLVRVYDCDENLICEVFTNADGGWSCNGAVAGDTYRVEYTTPLSSDLVESFSGTDNGTNVQFVPAGDCTADYGLVDLTTFCGDDPQVVVTCYEGGSGVGNTNPAMLKFRYDADGTMFARTTIATIEELGSVYGHGVDRATETTYVASMVKRHVGTGPRGLGGVYVADVGDAADLIGDFDLQGIAGIDVGSVNRSGAAGSDFFLPADPSEASVDLDAYIQSARAGFGDVEFTADGTLWLVNLKQNGLIRVDVRGYTATVNGTIDAGRVSQQLLPNLPGWPTYTSGQLHAWALNFNDGLGYVGVVGDGSTGKQTDLRAYVLSFDPQNIAAGLTEVLSFPLNYEREVLFFDNPSAEGEWRTWSDDWSSVSFVLTGGSYNPQPILSDLEFTRSGDLIIGLKDRHSIQSAADQFTAVPGSNTIINDLYSGGDILKACLVGGVYVLEGSTGCPVNDLREIEGPREQDNDGPGGTGEFFHGDAYTMPFVFHGEVATGALLYNPATDEIATTAFDAELTAGLNSQGIRYLSLTDGGYVRGATLIENQANTGDFAKGNALSDIELLCKGPLVEVGNYVWFDEDGDGHQDACEPPLAGVTVKLFAKPTATAPAAAPRLLATTVTDANGNYSFSGRNLDAATWEVGVTDDVIDRDSLYFIAFCGDDGFDATANTLTVGGTAYCVSPADATTANGAGDQTDSDVTVLDVGGALLPAYCTQPADLAGGSNHTFDAGFKPLIYDLALRKTLTAGQPSGFRPGDQVSFDIEVINQSSNTVYAIAVGDSIPTGMTFVSVAAANAGTTNGGTAFVVANNYATDESFVIDSLLGRDTAVLMVAVTIDAVTAGQPVRPLINYAEIQAFDNDSDPNNEPPTDEDSTPDDNFGNDSGNDPLNAANDATDGDGSGAPGDDDAMTDEDDSDPALVPVFDLALVKFLDPVSINPTGSYPPGTDVIFYIDVCNQGTDTVTNVIIKDYLPCGLDASGPINEGLNPGWSHTGGPTGDGTVNDSVFYTITTALPPTACLQIPIILRRRFDSDVAGICGSAPGEAPPGDFLTNVAEIRRFEDLEGNTPVDFDSTPDGDEDNDGGGRVNDATDNIRDGDGTGAPGSNDPATDEDDHDAANLDVFDLAIFKVVDSTDAVGPYGFGDVVKFDIGVVSQGNIAARAVSIRDIVPDGLRYDPALGTNASVGWQGAAGDAQVSLDIMDLTGLVNGAPTQDTLGVFDTATVSIWLEIVPGSGNEQEDFTNLAELISGGFNNPMTGSMVMVTADGDSPYSLGQGNDTGGGVGTDDDNQTLDNAPGEDIDSQDPAFVEVLGSVVLGDTTFIDVNRNGLQDDGDLPLANVTVTVIDVATGMPVTTDAFGAPYTATQVTDANGFYLFDDLPPGNYQVTFDIGTAPNSGFYDFTTANTGTDDALDSDAVPAAPTDDVGTSAPTGAIPVGDTVLTVDAGVVCAVDVTVAGPFTVCFNQPVDLTQDASVTPLSLGGNWTTDDPDGRFFDADDNEITGGPFAFGTAVSYRPGAAAAQRGSVTLTLTTNDPAAIDPDIPCAPMSSSVTIAILEVKCGDFFWDGE